MTKNRLFLDFETASELDLKVVGLDRYSKHPSTRPLMMAFGPAKGDVDLWLPHKGKMSKGLQKDLRNPRITKCAWNFPFEFAIFLRCLGIEIPYDQAEDTMILARHLSLPASLEKCGQVIGIKGAAKDKDGKRLIKYFCSPYHKGGELTLFGVSEPLFHNWEDAPRDWALFEEYCRQDVRAERAISEIVERIPFPEVEKRGWALDQKINLAGLPTNMEFARKALSLSVKAKETLEADLKQKTGLKNPNSRPQMLPWAVDQGYPYESMGKAFVSAAISNGAGSPLLREVLKLRQESSKTSYKKYENLLAKVGEDGRLRGQFAFLGASRSGRWSGSDGNKKGVQVQNLPRPTKEVEKKYDRALEIIINELFDAASKEFSSVIGMTTSCVRSAFQAPDGQKLVVCDLGAIENRVLGWLAGCDAILKVFRDGRDAYLDFAAKMYGVTYESLITIVDGVHKPKDKDAAEKRQIAKPAVLGCGYGLGPGVEKMWDGSYKAIIVKDQYGNMVKTGLLGYAENMGVVMTPEQAYLAWETFRRAYPEVTSKDGLWKNYEKAAISALRGRPVKVGNVRFSRRKWLHGQYMLRIKLPSGRGLHYINARVEQEEAVGREGKPYKRDVIYYDGIGHGVGKMAGGWASVKTYGGKLVENVDQAISRDILLHAMLLADEKGAEIVGHVHDEIIVLADDDQLSFSLEDLKRCMETRPTWADKTLVLAAEGWEGKEYRK